MLSTILSAFTVADIRKKLGFTALLLLFYRLGSHVPVPGVNTAAVEDIQKQFGGGGVLNFLNVFSGGGLSRTAIFALGIMPYITASIILQLLTVVVPSLEKLQKEGEVGTARITQYTRYLTVALAFAQSIGYVFLFRSFSASAGQPVIEHFDAPHVFLIVVSLTAGTILLMWMGELITQRGIGNGISLMAFPPPVGQLLNTGWATDFSNFFSPSRAPYVIGESVLIILFTYFYTAVTFNPVDQADNLKKYGGFIPGVRPGRPTAEFLDRILARLTFPGALFLAAVAALPTVLINQTSANFFFGGTSLLIVIGGALDTIKQLEAQLMMRNYEGFLK